jgi:hypothetical protein
MRTSALKKKFLFPRIERKIRREIDRATRAQNFTAIANFRKIALRAIVRDSIFFVGAQFRQADRECARLDEKKISIGAQIVK